MGLAEVQSALARLFTDADLRARFFADPPSVGRTLGLDEAESSGLAGLSPRHVAQFAATLRQKRIDDARKVLPLTSLALGVTFASRLLEAIDGPLPPGRHRDDARVLADHLSRSSAIDRPWAADLACYELALREAMTLRAGLIVRRFHYPVGQIAASIYRGEVGSGWKPRGSLGVWLRFPWRRGVLHLVL
jgi:hypothetical protein